MLQDILEFGVVMLVADGRLCMWMPTANDEDQELKIPENLGLELLSVSVQHFNKCEDRVLCSESFADEEQGPGGC